MFKKYGRQLSQICPRIPYRGTDNVDPKPEESETGSETADSGSKRKRSLSPQSSTKIGPVAEDTRRRTDALSGDHVLPGSAALISKKPRTDGGDNVSLPIDEQIKCHMRTWRGSLLDDIPVGSAY